MSRTVDEWVGRTDDSTPPPRVRLRVWDRFKGLCHACTRKILLGDAVQDTNPKYLERADFLLARRLYEALEMRVPHSITNRC